MDDRIVDTMASVGRHIERNRYQSIMEARPATAYPHCTAEPALSRFTRSLTAVFLSRDYRRIRESAYASVDGGCDMEASLASLVDE